MKLTTTRFSEHDTAAETARKLNAMYRQLQERLDVDSVRVGDTTKLDHNGNATFADVTAEDVTCEDVTAEDVTCEDVDAEDVDVETFTMATGAAADEILTSDADGKGTWETPAVQVAGSDKQVQFNDGGAFAGDSTFTFDKTTDVLSLDHLDMDGTETDELIDLDRTIDAGLTASAVTLTEARSGAVSSGVHAGFLYDTTLTGISGTCAPFAGFKSTITISDNSALAQSACFRGLFDSNGSSATNAQVFAGQVALDNEAVLSLPVVPAAVAGSIVASRSGTVYGAYTQAKNVGSGKAHGYQGYGWTTGAGTGMTAIGLYGLALSTNGVEVGLFATPQNKDANGLAICAKGHSRFYNGNLYLQNSTTDPTVTAVVDKSHVTQAEDGSLYVENQLEVDGAGHFDSTLDVDGQADFNDDVVLDKELKGGRCLLTASASAAPTSSRYLVTGGGVLMDANRGYPMARAGSIIGVAGQCRVASQSGGATCYIDVYTNGVLIASTGALACADHVGSYIVWSSEPVARGVAAFARNDRVQFYLRIVGTATIQYPIGTAELQFDT